MSDESKFKLLTAFKYMNQKIDMKDFNGRLVFQKKTYLLQEMGLHFGNTYGWYLYGPYSRDVTSEGFQLAPIQDYVNDLVPLSKSEKNQIERLGELISEAKKTFSKADDEYCLELLASLHFVIKHGYPRPKSGSSALKQFSLLKPKFSSDAKKAFELLGKYCLV